MRRRGGEGEERGRVGRREGNMRVGGRADETE